MKLIAATITFYFIGLVNFQGTGSSREVILPLATDTARVYRGQTLAAHRADIVITSWPSGASACASQFGGTWKDSVCTIEGLSGKTIVLPVSTESFRAIGKFNQLPRLQEKLCPGMGGLVASLPYAARLTVSAGQLDACNDGHAFVTRLTLTAATPDLTIGGKTATLDNGSVVHIINAPVDPPDGNQKKHFWWYYVMYSGTAAADCKDLPAAPTGVTDCPESVLIISHDMGAASGVGCSNTVYP